MTFCFMLKLMPPWFGEVLRFVVAGGNSGWFGLVCPAHCSVSIPYLLAILISGFGLGVLSTLGLLLYVFWPSFSVRWTSPPSPPPFQPPQHSRLAAYLHERAGYPYHCD